MPMSMSAADWTLLQRRKAGTKYMTDAVKQKPENPRPEERLCPRGALKINRTAGDFTNYVASQDADFVLTSQGSGRVGETSLNNNYKTQKVTRICNCSNSLNIILPKTGICSNCAVPQHVRIN